MSAVDAMWYWMSSAMPSDQFLVYGFTSPRTSLDVIAGYLRRRAATIDDLGLRVADVPAHLDRPYWRRAPVSADQVRVTQGPMTWQACLDHIAQSMDYQLDARQQMWRLHLYGAVTPAPGVAEGSDLVVAVLQVAHALGDGRRSSAIARQLFSEKEIEVQARCPAERGPTTVMHVPAAAALGVARVPIDVARMLFWGGLAFHHHRQRSRTTGSGTTGSGTTDSGQTTSSVAPTSINGSPGRGRELRTLTVSADVLTARGGTVTVGALTAISDALPRFLGDPSMPVTITLTVARRRAATDPNTGSRNDFRTVGIDLHTDIADLDGRASAIAAEIARARDEHMTPERAAARRAEHATPAPLRILGARQAGAAQLPERIDGISVVSSVDRGPADLTLGGGSRSVITAGFPALSPVHGLNHGVHGLGARVTLSVIAAPCRCPDIDRYLALLTEALRR
ncbi:hypothetical protein QNM97_06925 [Gordonia sp. L191]|uniref:hypothetical protein n=1 Tax=Gordonia sp. L191 TaxID=2982699 RepID=UPI0024BFC65E|nr:hypothetical protein [Gordonia sp. L191]WHU48718.1 hypothetical protein QNM97_06925 [Gordonia sp. L191]